MDSRTLNVLRRVVPVALTQRHYIINRFDQDREIGDEMTAQVARDELLSVFVSVLTLLTVPEIYLD